MNSEQPKPGLIGCDPQRLLLFQLTQENGVQKIILTLVEVGRLYSRLLQEEREIRLNSEYSKDRFIAKEQGEGVGGWKITVRSHRG